MWKFAIFVAAMSACGTAQAVDFDPDAACIFHVKKGEHITVPPGFMQFDGSKMRPDQTLWCIDDFGSLDVPGLERSHPRP